MIVARAIATRRFAAGEPVGRVARAIGETDGLEGALGAGPALGGRMPAKTSGRATFSAGVEARDQVERLEDEPDPTQTDLGEPSSERPATSSPSRK
jgi:hypothetical protein